MDIWRHKVRFVFASALAVTSLWTLIRLARPVAGGITSAVAAQARRRAGHILERTEQDLPFGWILALVAALLVPVAVLLHAFIAGTPLAPIEAPLMIAGVLFVALTGFMVAAVCALLGKIPTVAEYLSHVEVVNKKAADIYRYMNFDQIPAFSEVADTVVM